MEMDNPSLDDQEGLSDSSDIDDEIENTNTSTNKRPLENEDDKTVRSKSPRFDDIVSPATVVNSLEMDAQLEFLLQDFSTESSDSNDSSNSNENFTFLKEIFSFCEKWNGYITGAFALAAATDSLDLDRSRRNSHVVWKPGKIEDGGSLDIIFIVPRDKSYSTSDSNYNINSIYESFSIFFTKYKKYFISQNDHKSKLIDIELNNEYIKNEFDSLERNINNLIRTQIQNPGLKEVIDDMRRRRREIYSQLKKNKDKIDKRKSKISKFGQYSNNNILYDEDEDLNKDIVTIGFSSNSTEIAFDVQLIFYYKRGLTQKDRQEFSQYDDDESIKNYIQKIFIEEAVEKIYDYRMLHCYLDFNSQSETQASIKFNNQNSKDDIISKRLFIVDNPYQNYNSCLNSIIQSIQYYEKDFTPNTETNPNTIISMTPVDKELYKDNELNKFIISQRYRLFRSIDITYNNILNMRYNEVLQSTIPDENNQIVIGSYQNEAEVLNEEEVNILKNECIQRGLKLASVPMNISNREEIDIIYELPHYDIKKIIGWFNVRLIRSYDDNEQFRGWIAHIDQYQKIRELKNNKILKKQFDKNMSKSNYESKFIFPLHYDFENQTNMTQTAITRRAYNFISFLFRLNNELVKGSYSWQKRGLYDKYSELKVYGNLHYYEFDPKIINNEITILTNNEDEKHEKALCKTVTHIKNHIHIQNEELQILSIDSTGREGNTPMKSLNCLDEVFKPFTEFFKTIDIKLRPPSGKLAYLQIFAEQYDLAMNDKNIQFYDGPNHWPISFFEEDLYTEDESVIRQEREYEFFLPENETMDATDIVDHGGILKRFLTGLNNDFKFLVKYSYENKILFDNRREVLEKATFPIGTENRIIRKREGMEVNEIEKNMYKHFTEYPYEIMLLIILKFAKNHKGQQIIKIDDDLLNMIFNTVNIKIPYIKIISASGIVSFKDHVGLNNRINTQIICRLIQEMGCKEYEIHDLEGYDEMFSPNKLRFSNKLEPLEAPLIFTSYLDSINGKYNFRDARSRMFSKSIPKSSHANTLILLLNQFIETNEYSFKQFENKLINFFENIIRISFWKTAFSDFTNKRFPKFFHTEEYSYYIYKFLNPSFDIVKLNSENGKKYIKKIIFLETSNENSIEYIIDLETVKQAYERMDESQKMRLSVLTNVVDDDLDTYVESAPTMSANEFRDLYNSIRIILQNYRLNIDTEEIYNITKRNVFRYLNELSIDDKQHPNLEDFVLFVTNTKGFPDKIQFTLDQNTSPVRQGVARYPSSHTCWNELELPWYIDISDPRYNYDQFKESLDYSILNQSNIWQTNSTQSEDIEMQEANVSSQQLNDEDNIISPTTGGNKNDKTFLKYVGYW